MKYTIDWLERRKTKTGKDVIDSTLKDEQGVTIERVSIWDQFPNWSELRPGSEVNGEVKANAQGYKSLYPEMTKGFNRPAGGVGVKAAQERKQENIKELQDRKNESIAFFNATNSAITLITHLEKQAMTEQTLKNNLTTWRDWFLSEWQKYESGDKTDKHNAF